MDMAPRPAPFWTIRELPGLWRLVAACWVVSAACHLPALWVIGGAVSDPLSRMPDEGAPPGDATLIVVEQLAGIQGPIRLAVLSGCVTLWMWTVLWHAGLVGWRLWSGGRRLRLGEVLGLGMVAWWRYARLSITSLVVMAGALCAVWIPASRAVAGSYAAMAEGRMVMIIGLAVAVSNLIIVGVWAVAIRSAWLLGLPERRSVVMAWLRGLLDTVQTPISSLGTVALWLLPATLVTVTPLLVGGWFEGLRGGWTLAVVSQLSAVVRAVCWVGMFLSFAPVTGLVNDD
jgi:hypothetical protein